jgi:hypothetical protein
MRVQAVELREERAHPRGLARHVDAEQLLDRKHEDELVVLERDVVDAWGVRDRLPPRLLLHVLLEARVEVADHGLQADDRLAVELDHEPEHAVRRRMVRAEVDFEDVARVAQLLRHGQDRRHRRRDARPLVNRRARRG